MAKKTRGTKRTRRVARYEAAPIKLTQAHLTAREHKDLSTYEIDCRVGALRREAEANEAEIERLSAELAGRRRALKSTRVDVEALEALMEERR